MNGTNICIIDDGFVVPAILLQIENHNYFSGAAIQAMLSVDWEKNEVLKELCNRLLDHKTDDGASVWSIAGFRLPGFYQDAFDAGKYRADLIIFDWDYGHAEVDQIQALKKILEGTHAEVFIFTGADKINDIENVIAEDLAAFCSRIQLRDKNSDQNNAHDQLHHAVLEKMENNFAFKFGSSLRASVNRSLDVVLHRLSALNLNKVVKILASQDNDPIDADLKEMIGEKFKERIKADEGFKKLIEAKAISEEVSAELLEIVAEVIKTDVASLALEHDNENAPVLEEGDHEIMAELWSYRLYHDPSDNVVRGGDIILPDGGNGDELYMVLTPPCDLAQFWSKTDGKLAVVKLEVLPEQNTPLRERAKLFKGLGDVRKGLKKGVSSLTNGEPLNVLPGKSFLLPCVPVIKAGVLRLIHYRINSHSLTSIDVPLPADLIAEDVPAADRKNAALRYDHFGFSRVTKVSDPFCGAILSATLANLAGWGVADYPSELIIKFGQHLDTSLKEPQNGQA